MKRILVSLVSEQTIPNILLAAHYKPDVLWFISTGKSEKDRKTECIENTMRLMGLLPAGDNIEKILVDQDSLVDCMNKIDTLIDKVDGEVEYIVNITGGNKVMALAAYDIFREIGQKVIIDYMPLGRNEVIQFFPRKKPIKIFHVHERLNVEEYLSSYGFKIQNKDKLQAIKSRSSSRRDGSIWILNNYEQLKGLLGFLYRQLGDKRKRVRYRMIATYDRSLSAIEKEMFTRNRFEIQDRIINKDLTKDEIVYLTGGWFEEYVFNQVYELVQDGTIDDAMMGVKIESMSGASNDLDIVFVRNNVLHHIECKTLGEGDKEKGIIRDTVYKRGAISTLLGKVEKSIFTTLDQISEPVSQRAQDYGVKILSLEQVRDLKNRLRMEFGGKG